jgi:BASS family bile acid:Na+ symporter
VPTGIVFVAAGCIAGYAVAELLATLQNLFTFTFVVSSMFGMGLALTVAQILEPLRSLRLVALTLVANFVIVPATAVVLSRVIPLDEQLQIGLILFGCAAGAPFLPKLAQIAKANVAFAVGVMALEIVATVAYLPIVLPLLLPGVTVDAPKMAVTLFGEMLVPLAIGLAVRQRFAAPAADLARPTAQVSTFSLVLLMVLMLGLNISSVLGLIGSGGIIAMLGLIAVALVAGYVLGGPGPATRTVLALGTGQRNLAGAFLVATASFSQQPNVLVFLAAAGLVGMVILFPLSAELGKRARPAIASVAAEPIANPVVETAG